MKLLICTLTIMMLACTPVAKNVVPDNEKIMRYDAMHELCMEDAYIIGFATGYFGREVWVGMLHEMKRIIPYIPAR